MSVELHGAFVWDCDACGAENFVRAVEGNIDEAAMEAADNRVEGELIATEVVEGADGGMESGVMVQRILIAPATVKCRECGASDSTEVYTCDE